MLNSFKSELELLMEEIRRLKELYRKLDAEIDKLKAEQAAMRAKIAAWPAINCEQNEKKRALETEIAGQPPAKQLKSDTINQNSSFTRRSSTMRAGNQDNRKYIEGQRNT